MSKLSTLFAAALFTAAAGTASASTMLVDGSTTYTVKTASDQVVSFALPEKQSAGVIMDFNFSFTGTLQNNDYYALWFGSSTGPSFGLKANCGGGVAGCTNDLFLRMDSSKTTFLSGSDVTANTNYHLMGYLYKTGNSKTYNAFDMWVNPTDQQMISLTGANIHITGATTLSSVTNFGFRTVNIDNGVTLKASDIDVNAVPEPGTLALMGLAFAGLGFLRRRKQA